MTTRDPDSSSSSETSDRPPAAVPDAGDPQERIAEFVTWWHEHRNGSPNAAYARVDRFVKDIKLAPAAHQERTEPATQEANPCFKEPLKHQSPVGAPARAAEWQPLESAPRDKTLVIGALIRDGVVWRVHEMAFNGLAWYTKTGGSLPVMTHWLPLPPPRCPRGRLQQ